MFSIDRKKIVDLMEQLSMSQRALAILVHKSQPHINDVLKGYKEPSLSLACGIAKALELKLDDIIKEA